MTFPLEPEALARLVRAALEEDRAFDDVTTRATVPADRRIRAQLVARHEGILAGGPLAVAAFHALDAALDVRVFLHDGATLVRGAVVLEVEGAARAILSAERVALNFVQRLSGVATFTARYAIAIRGTAAQLVDTRKTTPGWRDLEKYAVRCGGGANHRRDLADAVLIKDNHLAACDGDIGEAVRLARAVAPEGMIIQLECDTLDQVRAALDAAVDGVLLDNMSVETLRAAVTLCRGRCWSEASGGVTLDTIRAIAETGVDRISVGALTHSAPALDLALDFL
ncbi:MAG: carboxylating nicotinate-nucleotide diphosphorylase [Gemmatimonadota bacterium]|nr:carboxylating nicotinate-nucleotide diphosphorylase [Gemmatimonadota bacterium]MDQ8147313.1 carboxylating nicotinate-nucleotide diphosphorylase [Gemmatimonadota bacterium]MDQ8149376.1 carboxylating nicotinate-nucleotide diphosphorylase [Gemmatimonadota bacterium]MDQ8176722.1 carboxylating nicotinate-nucleotide diphosphorylase [Gemmatimonadota bacterium]